MTNGVRLSYLEAGPPDAPPLVLLHGLGEDATSWDVIAQPLAARFRVLAFDLRGHGHSGRPGSYSFELMRDDMLGAVEELGLRRPGLIGHSMGGTVALLIAEDHPDLISKLVLEDAPPPRPLHRPDRERPDGPLPYDWAAVVAIRDQLRAPDPAWWDRLPQVTAPTLLIGGGPDSAIPQEWLRDAVALLPQGTLLTIPAGHYVHNTRPADFTAAVLNFLLEERVNAQVALNT
jgi:pimeloyl-ACP methyl ester carboxylesterase